MKMARSAVRRFKIIGLLIAAVVIIIILFVCHTQSIDNNPRYHALMEAIDRNDLVAVKSQIKSGTNPNDFPPQNGDEDDIAPLCAAVSDQHIEMVTLLLNCGSNVDMMDGWNSTPLEIASRNEDVPMIKLLLSHGAKVNDQSDGGSWALWGAAIENKPNAVRLLLSHGANPNTREDTSIPNQTLLSAVRDFHYTAIADLLKRAGAK